MKTCAICNDNKQESEFRQRPGRPAGQLQSYCRPCMSTYQRARASTVSGKASARKATVKYLSSGGGLARRRKLKNKVGGSDHRYRMSQKGRETQARAKAALLSRRPDYHNEYYRARVSVDPWFRAQFALRSSQRHHITNGARTGSFVRDIGCTREQFVARMEKLFQPGMTWANHGDWEYDHDVPLAAFDLTNREQFLAACNYQNIVPRWKYDNKSKGAKMPWKYEQEQLR